jgi:hypothetical protein
MTLLIKFVTLLSSYLELLVILVFLVVFVIDKFARKKESTSDIILSLAVLYISKPFFDTQAVLLNWIQKRLDMTAAESNLPDFICVFIGFILLILGIWLRKKERQVKIKLPVLNMLGMQYQAYVSQRGCENKLSKNEFDEKVIDFRILFDKTGQISEGDNKKICEMIKNECSSFVSFTSNSECAYFTGMSPIPYEVYAGTFLNGSNVNEYLEFDSKNSKKFYKLEKTSATQKELISPNPFHINETENIIESTELNLSIEVTSKISSGDLDQFQSLSSLKIGLQQNKDNLIREIEQLNSLKNRISRLMEEYGKKGINRIHITAAIPSCLAVEIGKEIVQLGNRLPEVVVYHYVRTSEKKYPFGLIVNGARKGELYHV